MTGVDVLALGSFVSEPPSRMLPGLCSFRLFLALSPPAVMADLPETLFLQKTESDNIPAVSRIKLEC